MHCWPTEGCHSSGLLLSNIFVFLSDFWVHLANSWFLLTFSTQQKPPKTRWH